MVWMYTKTVIRHELYKIEYQFNNEIDNSIFYWAKFNSIYLLKGSNFHPIWNLLQVYYTHDIDLARVDTW